MVGLEDAPELLDEAPDLVHDGHGIVEVDVVGAGDLAEPEVGVGTLQDLPENGEKRE